MPLLAGKAAVQGIRIRMIPFIRIQTLTGADTISQLVRIPLDTPWVLTSHNAVEALQQLQRKYLPALPRPPYVYAMEGRTAETFRQLFPGIPVKAVAGNAVQLAREIIRAKETELAFPCGNLRRQELPDQMKQHRILLHEVQVYETVSTSTAVTENYDGIMFFSPSGVASYLEKNRLKPSMECFAIGETTAAAIRRHTRGTIHIAPQPTQESIVNLIIEHYKQV